MTPAFIVPPAITALIDELRSAGFSIGLEEHLTAQELIVALIDRGAMPEDPARLSTMLAPILCSTRAEQGEFPQHFARWLERERVRVSVTDPQTRSPQNEVSGLRSCVYALTAIGAIGVCAAMYWFRDAIPKIELPPAVLFPGGALVEELEKSLKSVNAPPLWMFAAAAVAFGLIVLIYRHTWRRAGETFLERRTSGEPPRLQSLFVEGAASSVFRGAAMFRLVQKLRVHRRAPSDELDVPQTVDSTISNGGWFTPVHGTRPIQPEYLALIDRASFGDQQARLVNTLLDRFKAEGLAIERFEFDRDPRACFRADGGVRALRLEELTSRFPDHRLWIFSNGEGFVSCSTGRAHRWIGGFNAWRECAMLTMVPRESWGWREAEIERAGLLILPATDRGLSAFDDAQVLRALMDAALPAEGAPFPPRIERDPRRWTEPDPPDSAELEQLLGEVRVYLGEDGFNWLCACAVYPELQWELTVYLGHQVKTLAGEPVFDEQRLMRIARLPWMRAGHMPEWLRRRLIQLLPAARAEEVRAALEVLLLSAIDGPVRGFELELAKSEPSLLRRLWRGVFPRLAEAQEESGPLRDRVFLSSMSRSAGVVLPRAVARWLERWRRVRKAQPEVSLAPRALLSARLAAMFVGVAVGLFVISMSFSTPVLVTAYVALASYGALIVGAHIRQTEAHRLRHMWLEIELLSLGFSIVVSELESPSEIAVVVGPFLLFGLAFTIVGAAAIDRIGRLAPHAVARFEWFANAHTLDRYVARLRAWLRPRFEAQPRPPQSRIKAGIVSVLFVSAVLWAVPEPEQAPIWVLMPLLAYACALVFRQLGNPPEARREFTAILALAYAPGLMVATLWWELGHFWWPSLLLLLPGVLALNVARPAALFEREGVSQNVQSSTEVNALIRARRLVADPRFFVLDRVMPDRILDWLADDHRTEEERARPSLRPGFMGRVIGNAVAGFSFGICIQVFGRHAQWAETSVLAALEPVWSSPLIIALAVTTASAARAAFPKQRPRDLTDTLAAWPVATLELAVFGLGLWFVLHGGTPLFFSAFFAWMYPIAAFALLLFVFPLSRTVETLGAWAPGRLFATRASDEPTNERRAWWASLTTAAACFGLIYADSQRQDDWFAWLAAFVLIMTAFAESRYRTRWSRIRLLIDEGLFTLIWSTFNSFDAIGLLFGLGIVLLLPVFALFTLAGVFRQRRHPLAAITGALETAAEFVAPDRLLTHATRGIKQIAETIFVPAPASASVRKEPDPRG